MADEMATSSETLSKKQMKRLESRKSHSWWWDSHISPKNSKWLAENLERMDKSVKRMLKLIEEDGDSFAKKAEMYYQKRPELIFLVEEFYRMYRSLAERYDHVTGELRKNIPSDLQSQCSGSGRSGSEIGSEQSSALPSPKKHGHRKSNNRAAGFDFFLGSGGNGSDVASKEGYESSTSSNSSSESDDSSVNNDSGFPVNINEHHAHSRKIMELEIELRDLKEKLWLQEEEHAEKGSRNENFEDIHAKVKGYEQELKSLNEKLRLSEKQVSVLKIELDRIRSTREDQGSLDRLEQQPDSNKIKSLEEELRVSKEELEASKMQIASLEFEAIQSCERIQQLQDEACKDIAAWKTKFNSEKRDSLERLASIKLNLLDRDHEITDLKVAVSDTEQKMLPEKAEICKLMEKQAHLEEEMRKIKCEKAEMEGEIEKRETKIKGLKAQVGSLKGEGKSRDEKVEQLVWHLNQLHMEHVKLIGGMEEAQKQVEELEEEVERQRREILEGAEEKREAIRQLCLSLEHYRNDYDRLRQDYIECKRVSVLAA